MSPHDSSGEASPGRGAIEGTCALPADRAVGVLIAGLTKGGDHTPGLSVLFDAREELSGLASVVAVLPNADDLAPLLDGLARRLGAALELLRAELATAGPAGAP